MKLKRLFCLMLLFALPYVGFCQKGYFFKDSVASMGVQMVTDNEITNAMYCQVQRGTQVVVYRPQDIQEYGFNDGRSYISRRVIINGIEKLVFLERLSKGSVSLFYYRDETCRKYFIEKNNDGLVELQKATFRDVVRTYMNECAEVDDALKLVSFNRKSLSVLGNQYSACKPKWFPHLQFGLFVGYAITTPSGGDIRVQPMSQAIPIDLKDVDFKSSNTSLVGVALNIPIYRSNFSVRPEVTYQKNNFENSGDKSNYDIQFSATKINISLMPQYNIDLKPLRIYLNGGLTYSLNSVSDSYVILKSGGPGQRIDWKFFPNAQLGYNFGIGVEQRLNYRCSAFVEMKYMDMLSFQSGRVGCRNIMFIAGVNF